MKIIKWIVFISAIANAFTVFRTTYRSGYLIDAYATSAGEFLGGGVGIALNWLGPVFAVIVAIGSLIWLVQK